MAEYLIYFNDQWVPDYTLDELREIAKGTRAVIADMKEAGVFVFTDGPLAETKEYLGGLCVIDVPDEESARMWAARVAVACTWPQEVRRFHRLFALDTTTEEEVR